MSGVSTHVAWMQAFGPVHLPAGNGDDSPVMRKLSAARDAFENLDPDASKIAHQTKTVKETGHGDQPSIILRHVVDGAFFGLLAATIFISATTQNSSLQVLRHAHTLHTRARAHTCTHARARTHAHTMHTRTERARARARARRESERESETRERERERERETMCECRGLLRFSNSE